MSYPEVCPHCGVSLQGKLIPAASRATGGYGAATHFSRVIAVYDRDRDRTVAWHCPDCGEEWER